MATKNKRKNSFSEANLMPMLREGIVKILFRKANGQFRGMNATTSRIILNNVAGGPFSHKSMPVAPKPDKSNPNVVTVWDVDNWEWRSIRYDSIISVSYSNVVIF